MRTAKIISSYWNIGVSALIVLGGTAQNASSQIDRFETQFQPEYVDAPCPPDFRSMYYDEGLGMTFHGRSVFTMTQHDEYHASIMYTYAFEGRTTDGNFKITGTHHVASGQCIHAAWSYWTGAPAVIARLHNAKLFNLASLSCGTEPPVGDHETYSPPQNDPSYGTGCGGTSNPPPLDDDEWYEWYDGVRFRCHNEQDDTGWDKTVCIAES